MFLNTLPFRQKLSGGTWLELVQETFQAERESLPFRRYPMARMQQDLGNHAPLFETIFNYTHFHVYDEMQNVSGVEVLGYDGVADTNFMFGVDFSLYLRGSGIKMELHCDAGQWSESQLEAASALLSHDARRDGAHAARRVTNSNACSRKKNVERSCTSGTSLLRLSCIASVITNFSKRRLRVRQMLWRRSSTASNSRTKS